MLRNEVNAKASERSDGISIQEERTQRHTLGLKNVAYIIRADIYLPPGSEETDPAKYRDQFRRRVADGRCYHMPYLGCREFSAHFEQPHGDEKPIDLTDNLGLMLHDLTYISDGSGRGTPKFFEAKIVKGILTIPPFGASQKASG